MKNWIYLPILAVFLLLHGCKKKEAQTVRITGTVLDGIAQTGLSGATVVVRYKAYQTGVASGAFQTAGTYTTGAGGVYDISFEKPTATEYQIEVYASEYFGEIESINPDNISASSANTRNYTIYPSATVSVHIKNLNPYDANDKIVFSFTNPSLCSSCCSGVLHVFDGMNVDTTITCMRYGNSYAKFQRTVTKMSMTYTINDSVYCPKGQTGAYTLNY